jgi:hypothetical protein
MSQWEAQGINLNLRVQLHDKLADYNKALNEGLSDAAMLRLGLYFLQKCSHGDVALPMPIGSATFAYFTPFRNRVACLTNKSGYW